MKIQFGFCLPIFAAPGNLSFRVPNWSEVDASVVLDLARRADGLGFDSIWVADHLMLGKDESILEGWTTLSAIAGATEKIRLGLIHQSNILRNPALVAKMTATLDHLSAGRLIHFFDAGNNEREHRAYGFPWEDEIELRVDRMEEALQVIMNLWTAEGPYTHRGRFYAVDEAVCLPRPLQRPHPPVWIGETRGGLLDVCARYGQGWNSVPVGIEEWNRRRESLREACVRIGRNVDEIEYSYETQILIAADRTALRDKVRKMLSLGIDQGDKDWVAFAEGYSDELPASLTDRFLIGTPEEIKTQIQSYVDVGVAHFMLWFMDAPDEDGLALFSKEIIGAFSS